MMNAPLWLYIAAMAVVTYLIRAVPFVFFRRQIKSRFVKSLLYYLPYAVLATCVDNAFRCLLTFLRFKSGRWQNAIKDSSPADAPSEEVCA